MAGDCIFCKISKGEIPAKKLYEDDELVAFWDTAPQAPIHFLVIPKKHLSGPAGTTAADDQLIGKVLRKGAELAAANGAADCRLVMNNGPEAGQTVFHLHMHVLGGRPMTWPPG
jgi:histidine triad (HIT) family protein